MHLIDRINYATKKGIMDIHMNTNAMLLTEELSNIEQEILKAVPQLKEQIHGFVEQLQEALKLPPSEQTESAATEPEQIEI